MQPHSVGLFSYHPKMRKKPIKQVLWENILAVMTFHYGKENLTRLASDCKIGPGTVSRIKAQGTSVGLEVIETIAGKFNLEPWQLLVSGMSAEHPPVLRPVTDTEKALYSRLTELAREIADLERK